MSEERRAPQNLTSWKEIADYFQVSVRTAQAWEHEKGLPVQRFAGKKGRVSADPAELDRWKQSVSRSNHWLWNPRYLKTYAALATALLVAAAAYESVHYWSQSTQTPPTSILLKGGTGATAVHQGKGRSGMAPHEAVAQTGSSETVSALHRKISFADIDNDGELETILDYSPVQLHPSPSQLNRQPTCEKESEEPSPAPAGSAGGQELPLTSNLEGLAVFGSVRSFKGGGLLSGCQLPIPLATLLATATVAEKKAIGNLHGNKGGQVAGKAQPHCAHCK